MIEEAYTLFNNANGSRLEVFESGIEGRLSFVYFDKTGNPYPSRSSIPSSELDDLVAKFTEDDESLVSTYNLNRQSEVPSNLVGLAVVLIIVVYSVWRSSADYKLILLVVPVAALIIYAWFRPVKK